MFCRRCSYPLEGLASRECPECGRRFDPADRSTFREKPADVWQVIFTGLTHFLAMILVPVMLFTAVFAYKLDAWVGITEYALAVWIFAGVGVVLTLAAWALGKSRLYLIAGGAYLLFILLLSFVDMTPVKPFVRSYRDIDVGMSEREVQAVIDRHFPKNGRFKSPARRVRGGGISYLLDPSDGPYNAALLRIEFDNGACVGKDFLPD